MIARIWRGATRAEDAAAYVAYLRETGLKEYRATPGNVSASDLWRVAGDRAEFVTLSFSESLDAVRAFAGEDEESLRPHDLVPDPASDLQDVRSAELAELAAQLADMHVHATVKWRQRTSHGQSGEVFAGHDSAGTAHEHLQ